MSRTSSISVLALVAFLLSPLPASATTITVTTTDDEINADGDCGLREAIRAANTNAAVDDCDAGSNTETDTIVVPAGTYTLKIVDDFNDQSLGGDLDVVDNAATEDLVIDGASAATTIIQGCEVDQKTDPCPAGQGIRENVLENLTAHLTIQDVTIRHGFHTNGGGGGIWNVLNGVVTVQRCIISDNRVGDNSSIGGGGMFCDNGACNVVDSTIRDNVAFSDGGGIRNDSLSTGLSVLTITGSTISGNTATGAGGGIANLSGGTVVITNSTISGNNAGQAGGIFSFSAGASFPHHLDIRSSTITDNTVREFGSGKGGIETDTFTGVATIRNSIVAGNIDNSTPVVSSLIPDCGGPLVSEGYNLIGNDAHCTITPVIGDQIGTAAAPIDPLLGPLADNGGPTRTRVPLAGSPLISAGNPAAPGSGGTACPTTDQRGITRPQGSACDPGAVEVAGGAVGPGDLGLAAVKPSHGGNAGTVVTVVYGSGIVDGAAVKLTRDGQPDVVGIETTVFSAKVVATQLDLRGVAPGTWNVVVTNPGATSATLTDAFTVDAGGRADLWIELVMAEGFIFNRTSTVQLTFGNRGNVDAYDVPLFFSFPDELTFHLPFAITPPPAQPGQIPSDWTIEAVDVPVPPPADRDSFPLLIPVLPAGSSRSLRFRLTAPGFAGLPPDRQPLPLAYDIGRPYFEPDLAPASVASFVARAKQHAAQVFDTTTFPADAVIEQYVRTQLGLIAGLANGTAVSQVGAPLRVYSLAQLLVDTTQFIAGQSETVASRDPDAFDRHWLAGLVEGAWLGAGVADARTIKDPDCDPGDIWCERFDPCEDQPPTGPCKPTDPPLIKCDKVNQFDDVFIFVPCKPNTLPKPVLGSKDPNDKIGPNGPGGFITGLTPIPYTVLFENKSNATAAAQEVLITDQLDVATLDLATFSLGPMGFGLEQVTPPAGLTSYTTDVDLRPGKDLLVRIEGSLNTGTGLVTWKFTALDPATGELPEDPTLGFLPPNVTSPAGEGFVQFTVSPKAALTLGTEICNAAHIVFDLNAPIDTPAWCNVIGAPEDCDNCADDDGNGFVDRADPSCAPTDGGGVGLASPDAAKALDKCAKGIRKIGTKLGATRTKLIEGCLKAVADCVQLKPGDLKCLPAATKKCTKAEASLLGADGKAAAGVAKACAAPGVDPANLAAVTGLGYANEAGLCAARGVASLATLDAVTTCIGLQHACAAGHLIAAAVPRAAELLTLGGWDPGGLCIEQPVNGGGSGVALAKRKALRKCDLAIQKATTALGVGRAKVRQACGAAVFTCVQKGGQPDCLDKAGDGCVKAAGGLAKLGDKFETTITKACGAAPLVPADLLAPEGLGFGELAETCAALQVPSLTTLGDLTTCLAKQAVCRTDQALRSDTPRLDELLRTGGISSP